FSAAGRNLPPSRRCLIRRREFRGRLFPRSLLSQLSSRIRRKRNPVFGGDCLARETRMRRKILHPTRSSPRRSRILVYGLEDAMLLLRALLISALAVPAAQPTQATSDQGGLASSGSQQVPDASTTAVVPQQIRRAEPPAKNASAAELEESGDQLRAQNDYADAIDYYRAAMAKADSAALHNKIGI